MAEIDNEQRESVKVLQECIDLQIKKSQDYQAEKSSVRQADYYPRGLETLYDIVWAKMLRIRSVLDKGGDTNFESIEDSFKDLINYASFSVAWCRGKVDGQQKKIEHIDIGGLPFEEQERILNEIVNSK